MNFIKIIAGVVTASVAVVSGITAFACFTIAPLCDGTQKDFG